MRRGIRHCAAPWARRGVGRMVTVGTQVEVETSVFRVFCGLILFVSVFTVGLGVLEQSEPRPVR